MVKKNKLTMNSFQALKTQQLLLVSGGQGIFGTIWDAISSYERGYYHTFLSNH